MQKLVSRFVKCELGATAIEYGLIAALLSVAIITVLVTVGGNLTTTYTKVGDALATANAKN